MKKYIITILHGITVLLAVMGFAGAYNLLVGYYSVGLALFFIVSAFFFLGLICLRFLPKEDFEKIKTSDKKINYSKTQIINTLVCLSIFAWNGWWLLFAMRAVFFTSIGAIKILSETYNKKINEINNTKNHETEN